MHEIRVNNATASSAASARIEASRLHHPHVALVRLLTSP